MRMVSIGDAKQKFSRLVKDVEASETVVITRWGKLVAALKPQPASRLDDPKVRAAYERLQQLFDELPRDGYRVGKITEEDKYGPF